MAQKNFFVNRALPNHHVQFFQKLRLSLLSSKTVHVAEKNQINQL